MVMNKIPEINRARGYFLYTADGKRYLDMALDGGRLIMGHRQKGYGQAMKNAMEKGILPSFPSPYPGRLKKVLKELLGQNSHIYLFKTEERATSALAAQGLKYTVWHPFGSSSCDPINVTRKNDLINQDLPIVPLLPVPEAFAPGVVVSSLELPLVDEPVSPVILAGAVRALYNLKAFLADADYSDWEKAGLLDACGDKWNVELPYLYPKCSQKQYPAIWATFFEAGVILSPDYHNPSLLPPFTELSDGSRKKLLKLFTEC